ncbi:MAG: M48 family metalloprotease [Hyphomicrobiaceae bacterium]
MQLQEMRKRLVEHGQSNRPAINELTDGSTSSQRIPNHSATRGLFGHIQANNFRSIIVFAVFLCLIQVIQLAVLILVAQPERGRTFQTSLIRSALLNPGASISRAADQMRSAPVERPAVKSLSEDIRSDLALIWKSLTTQGGLFDGRTLWILIPSTLYVFGGLWFASVFVRRQTGARRVARSDEPRLYRTVEKLTMARGLPMPAIEVIDSAGRNAYASGFHPRNSAVGVSRGLLDNLNDAELEAVLAHEVAHIEGRDNRLMTIANLCTGAVSSVGRNLLQWARDNTIGLLLAANVFICFVPAVKSILFIVLVFGAWCIADLVRKLISQKREFIADARAIEIMKSPAALISALRKVARNDAIDGLTPEVQAMMISNLSDVGAGTHPSIDARVRAIEETTSVNWAEVQAIGRQPAPANAAGELRNGDLYSDDAPNTFGRRRRSKTHDLPGHRSTIENEKLEDVYKLLVGLDGFVVSVVKGVAKFLTYAPFLTWLMLPVALLAALLSSITGLPASASLIIVLGGALIWWYRPKRVH